MSYNAIVSKIKVAPHPNADRLQLGYVRGARVVVSLETQDDQLGVFFPADGQISAEFATAHDLVARKDAQGNRAGGFFETNRRVRAQNLRGVRSEGFWVPLSYFEFTGYDVTQLTEGMEFDTLNKIPICNKFYTKATLSVINGKKRVRFNVDMPEHGETAQFRFVDVPTGAYVSVSEKEHGTSFRYGYVDTFTPRKWWQRLFSRSEYVIKKEYVLGTRRAILGKKNEQEFTGGYYGNGDPYTIAPAKLHGKLKPNEIVYGEVVGFLKIGAALFTQNAAKLPDVKKQYGENVVFKYGCLPGESKLKVYRIVQDGRDLSRFEIERRCEELGVEMVRELDSLVFDGDRDALNARVEALLEGPSTFDDSHLREGVCLRIESPHGIRIVKAKSWTFGVLEGYIKDDENYVDAEEVA